MTALHLPGSTPILLAPLYPPSQRKYCTALGYTGLDWAGSVMR